MKTSLQKQQLEREKKEREASGDLSLLDPWSACPGINDQHTGNQYDKRHVTYTDPENHPEVTEGCRPDSCKNPQCAGRVQCVADCTGCPFSVNNEFNRPYMQ